MSKYAGTIPPRPVSIYSCIACGNTTDLFSSSVKAALLIVPYTFQRQLEREVEHYQRAEVNNRP